MKPALNLIAPQKTARSVAVPSDVLYIAEHSIWGELGREMVSTAFHSVFPVLWSPGMPEPDLSKWRGDWIISFKSDLILPYTVLDSAKKGSLNFHPNPPKYRGVGGYWWALHNDDDVFGVTCHHMDERIDHGAIIKTENFPIRPEESVESLKNKSAAYSLMLLNGMLDNILGGKPLVASGEKWEPHLYTYRELELAQKKFAQIGDCYATRSGIKSFKAFDAILTESPQDKPPANTNDQRKMG